MIFPLRCAMIRRYVLLDLYGELSTRKRSVLQSHIAKCKACSDYCASLHSTLTAMEERPASEPGEAFWSGYWPSVRQRLEERLPLSIVHRRGSGMLTLRPVYAGITAIVLVIVGVIVGRVVQRSPDSPPPGTQITQDQARELAQCLDKTELILEEIVNNGDAYAAAKVLPSANQREVSLQLAARVWNLRGQLDPGRDMQLRQLLGQMEILLEQIAHLDAAEIKPGIGMIRDGAKQEMILPKIVSLRRALDRHMPVPAL